MLHTQEVTGSSPVVSTKSLETKRFQGLNIPARGNRESGEMETAIPVEREPLFR